MKKYIFTILSLTLFSSLNFAHAGGTEVVGGAPIPWPMPGDEKQIVIQGPQAVSVIAALSSIDELFKKSLQTNNARCFVDNFGGGLHFYGSIEHTIDDVEIKDELNQAKAQKLCGVLKSLEIPASVTHSSSLREILSISCENSETPVCSVWYMPVNPRAELP
jgi:hypothetical protein